MVTPAPRYREPERNFLVRFRLEDALEPHHPARMLWEALGRLDLSAFDAPIKAVEGRAGRRPHSPRLLLALWGYAFSQGIVHAREISRRIKNKDLGFLWLVGTVAKVDHSCLSDFLNVHAAAVLAFLPRVLAPLQEAHLLELPGQLLAQDGLKIEASAGPGSFRQADSLPRREDQARLHLKAILARMDEPPPERATTTSQGTGCARRARTSAPRQRAAG